MTEPTMYRGFTIRQQAHGWEIYNAGTYTASCATAWGCIVYIDELLQP